MVRSIGSLLGTIVRRERAPSEVYNRRERCLVCDASLVESQLYSRLRVCPVCTFHYSMTARERIDSLADTGTFHEINRSVVSLDPLSFSSRVSYRERLFRDQRRTGLTEAAVTGTCSIGGSAAVLVVLDFGFMGGSMGCVVGEKVALALEHAVKKRLPAVAVVTSGGSRIQEGVLSLMQMAKTSIAATQLDDRGLPFISVLANPATGQAYASFANLADIILAEPGAIVGLAPLRVLKESSDGPLPHGSQTAEAHLEHGMLDRVVERPRLRELLAALLDLLGPRYRLTRQVKTDQTGPETQGTGAWDSVQLARHVSRPTARDYIERIFNNFVEIHGDRAFGDDPALIAGLAHLGGQTVMVVAQESGAGGSPAARRGGMISPEGFRKAQRAMRLAAKFGVPLISLIDTPGPYTSVDAEQRGLGNAIATTMALMGALEVPSIAAIIGEGGSEGALALAVADRVLMMEHAIYSIISPEGAAELIFQDEARADEVAESLRLTAHDCLDLGIIDDVVAEPPGGAHTSPEEAARQLQRVLLRELAVLQEFSNRRLLRARYKRFRKMGEYGSHFRSAITREVNSLQGLVITGVKRIARRGRRSAAESTGAAAEGETRNSE